MNGVASSWVGKQSNSNMNLFWHVQNNTHEKKHCEVLSPLKTFQFFIIA